MNQLSQRGLDRHFLAFLVFVYCTTLLVGCTPNASKSPKEVADRGFLPPTDHQPYVSDASQFPASQEGQAADRKWPTMPPEFGDQLQAALNWENGSFSWFNQQMQTTIQLRDMAHEVPCIQRLFSGKCPNMPTRAHAKNLTNVDAALFFDARTAYFFHDDQFSIWDVEAEAFTADSPQPISGTSAESPWLDFPETFQENLDAAVNDGLGNLFFFKGDQFLCYERFLGHVIGEPVSIAEKWPLLPRTFHAGIDAAMRLGRGRVVLFKDGMQVEVQTTEVI